MVVVFVKTFCFFFFLSCYLSLSRGRSSSVVQRTVPLVSLGRRRSISIPLSTPGRDTLFRPAKYRTSLLDASVDVVAVAVVVITPPHTSSSTVLVTFFHRRRRHFCAPTLFLGHTFTRARMRHGWRPSLSSTMTEDVENGKMSSSDLPPDVVANCKTVVRRLTV